MKEADQKVGVIARRRSLPPLITNQLTAFDARPVELIDAIADIKYPPRRADNIGIAALDFEALRDSLLAVSGRLDTRPGGPADPVHVSRNGMVTAEPGPGGYWRRSVYLQFRRTEIPSLLDTFDYPEMGPNCLSRSVSTVSPQSLMLMNNEHVRQLAASFAADVESRLGDSDRDNRGRQVDLVYQLALSRMPGEVERQIGIDTLKEIDRMWKHKPRAALETYCHTILNSGAFLYID